MYTVVISICKHPLKTEKLKMVRGLVTVNVGECGINVGHTVWQQYCAEHKIDCDGILPKNNDDDGCFRSFFDQTRAGKFIPRNLMISLDPEAIDNIQNNSKYKKMYDPNFMLYDNQGSGHIFARGHYTAGKEIVDRFNDRIRRLVDSCDKMPGFIINHCVSSGTGSGLTTFLLERLAVDYRKQVKIGFHTFASHDHKSNSVLEAYNEILGMHWLLDHTEDSVMFDNNKLYQLCQKYNSNNLITFQDMNILISKIESCWTESFRFEGEMSVDLSYYHSSLAVFPRLHFRIPSLAPLIPKVNSKNNNQNSNKNKETSKSSLIPKFNQSLVDGFVRLNYTFEKKLLLYDDLMNIVYQFYSGYKPFFDVENVNDLWVMALDCDYFTVDLDPFYFDPQEDKCMDVRMVCRGGENMTSKNCNAACQYVKNNKKVTFVEWCPAGFRIGLNKHKLATIKDLNDNLNFDYGNVCCIQNNTAISQYFVDKFIRQFDKMYSQRAFVHWYVREGMEEGEFNEAREDLGFLEKDYLDVLSEQTTDEADDEY